MKFFVKIVLALFLVFIAMPTVIGIVDKDVDTAYFYNMTEEEENLSSFNEIKMVHDNLDYFTNLFAESLLTKVFIPLDERLNCNFASSILLPPPELI